MTKTILLGASGFLGSYFSKEFGENFLLHARRASESIQYDYIANIETEKEISQLFRENHFETLINCIALADIEKCESDPESARWLNHELPSLLAKHSTKNQVRMCHISTDAVFNSEIPFASEGDPKTPKSVYAITKLDGENSVLEAAEDSCIFRVNFFGASPIRAGLLEFFYQNLELDKEVLGYKDVYFTPLYAQDAVRILKSISESGHSGVFHVVGTERLSKYEFGRKVALAMNVDVDLVIPVNYQYSPLNVNRTRDLSLSTHKVRSLGYRISKLDHGIKRAVMELRNG